MFKKLQYVLTLVFYSHEKHARKSGVKIGSKCSIATRHFGSEPYLITIGDHVQITDGVRFFTHGGGWVLRSHNPDFDFFGKIIIGNNVYIGNCAIILPGIKIGDNVIIGAGSLITKSIPSGVIVAGNPAKIIGNVENYEKKFQEFNLNIKKLNPLQKRMFLLSLEDSKFIRKPYLQ